MIVVRAELWPHGNEEKARKLLKMTITNDGSGGHSIGNYNVRVAVEGNYLPLFPLINHKKNEGFVKLIILALEKLYSLHLVKVDGAA